MKAVIIAAGISSRILQETNGIPKTLLPFGKGTILSTILANFSECGIDDFILVVGYEPSKIISYLEVKDYFDHSITFVENPHWERGNGLSVLAAEEIVAGETFILSMSDHIIPASAINRLISYNSHKNLLLVDRRIDKIFDIDDATKVYVKMNKIIRIGKNIEGFNGIDCGVFRLNNRYFDAMRMQLKAGKESNSAAIEGLIQNHDMAAVFMEEHEDWIDIDTPAAYQYALKKFVSF
jgi:choline kinase